MGVFLRLSPPDRKPAPDHGLCGFLCILVRGAKTAQTHARLNSWLAQTNSVFHLILNPKLSLPISGSLCSAHPANLECQQYCFNDQSRPRSALQQRHPTCRPVNVCQDKPMAKTFSSAICRLCGEHTTVCNRNLQRQ